MVRSTGGTGLMPLTVICVVDRRRNTLSRALRHAGNTVIETFTTDQAVALCVSNKVDAVILDQEFFVETDGWSVAQSIKLVKPRICVLLATRARALNDRLPKAVDAMVSHNNTKGVLDTLEQITGSKQ